MRANGDGGDAISGEQADIHQLAVVAQRKMVRPRGRTELDCVDEISSGRLQDVHTARVIRYERLARPRRHDNVVHAGAHPEAMTVKST
jgi:hypothetical protein